MSKQTLEQQTGTTTNFHCVYCVYKVNSYVPASLMSGSAGVSEEETLISQMSNKLMNLSAITEPRDVIRCVNCIIDTYKMLNTYVNKGI